MEFQKIAGEAWGGKLEDAVQESAEGGNASFSLWVHKNCKFATQVKTAGFEGFIVVETVNGNPDRAVGPFGDKQKAIWWMKENTEDGFFVTLVNPEGAAPSRGNLNLDLEGNPLPQDVPPPTTVPDFPYGGVNL